MYHGYTESPSKIAARKARILANYSPPPQYDPTLKECLQMEASVEVEKRERNQQAWAALFQPLEVDA